MKDGCAAGCLEMDSPGSIQAIDRGSVHRICSGQVVLTLATAVKELVENSLDASATNIEIRLKEYGRDSIEVIDNGTGVEEGNVKGLTLKHHTSKLRDFSDLSGVETFGFRGEALSSLCALSNVSITTRHRIESVGRRLEYDHHGHLVQQTPCSRQRGTTVCLQGLFSTLPVRHKEFHRNLKKEFAKMVVVLNAYCIVSTGVKISCTNHIGKGNRTVVVKTSGNESMRDNITNVFGTKQVQSLLELQQHQPSDDVCTEFSVSSQQGEVPFKVSGFVSSCDHGSGRSSTDRQFVLVNKRPCDLTKVIRLVNEVYHSYNKHQYPFIVLNVSTHRESVDVNVTPDKRQIFLQSEKLLLATVKASLVKLFEPRSSLYQYNQPPLASHTPIARSSNSTSASNTLASEGWNRPTQEHRLTSSLTRLKRNFSSAFASRSPAVTPHKQRCLDTFISRSPCSNATTSPTDHGPPSPQMDHGPTSPQMDHGPTSPQMDHGPTSSQMDHGPTSLQTDHGPTSQQTDYGPTSQQMDRGPTSPHADLGPFDETNQNLHDAGNSFSAENLDESDILYSEQRVQMLQNNGLMVCVDHRDHGPLSTHPGDDQVVGYSVDIEQLNGLDSHVNTQNTQFHSHCDHWPKQGRKNNPSILATPPDSLCHMDLSQQSSSRMDTQGFSESSTIGETTQTSDSEQHFENMSYSEESTNPENASGIDHHKKSQLSVEYSAKTRDGAQDGKQPDVTTRWPCSAASGGNRQLTNGHVDSDSARRDAANVQPVIQEVDKAEEVFRKQVPVRFSMKSLRERAKLMTDTAERDKLTSATPTRTFRAKIAPEENSRAEEELGKKISKDMFPEMEILGQFNLGFIITRLRHDLFIIDQHATDEKYNYEMLRQQMTIQSQKLIHPQKLELTAVNEDILIDNVDIFYKNGFEFVIDKNAPPTQKVRLQSIPVSRNWMFGKEDIEELIFMLTDSPGVMCRPSRICQMFASRSCRMSVMIGTSLNTAEMKKIVSHMGHIEQPWNCPHGRPTMRHLVNLKMLSD